MLLLSILAVASSGIDSTPSGLAAAVTQGRADEVGRILQEDASLARIHLSSTGATALHVAAARGDETMANVLIEHAAVDAATTNGMTALHMACSANHVDLANILLNASAATEASTRSGETALHLAVANGAKDAARLLLQRGSDVNAVTSSDGTLTPLLLAAMRLGDAAASEMAQLLLEHGASASAATTDGVTALEIAVRRGASDLVRVLLAQGADAAQALAVSAPEVGGGQPDGQPDGSPDGSPPAEDGASRDAASRSLLHLAVERGYAVVARQLLDHRADPDAATLEEGVTPLLLAVSRSDAAMIALLLRHGASVDKGFRFSGETPLILSCMRGDVATARILLDAGASLRAASTSNQTALLAATIHSDGTELLRLLCERGASVDVTWRLGATALMEAAGRGHTDAMALFIERGADPSARDAYGDTALHWAAAKGHEGATRLLLQHEASPSLVDARNDYGLSPMHAAAFSDAVGVIRLLSDAGSTAAAQADGFGATPLDLARSREGVEAMVASLRRSARAHQPWWRRLFARLTWADARAMQARLAVLASQSSSPDGREHEAGQAAAKGGMPADASWAAAAMQTLTPLERGLLVEADPMALLSSQSTAVAGASAPGVAHSEFASRLVRELAAIKGSVTYDRRVRSMLMSAADVAMLRAPGVLSDVACDTLRREIDRRASTRNGTTDGMPEYTLHLGRRDLEELIGVDAVERVWRLPHAYRQQAASAPRPSMVPMSAIGGSSGRLREVEIFVRKFSSSTRPWIKLHADVAAVTVNIALTGDSAHRGGRLLGIYDGAARAVERQAGDATVHPSSLLHGVSRMYDEAARYTLIVFFSED